MSRADGRLARTLLDEAVARLDARDEAVERRGFLRLTGRALAAAFLAACGSSGPEGAAPALRYAARRTEAVERWILRHTAMGAPLDHAAAGAATAGLRFPAYHVADVVPTWDAAARGAWALQVDGLVARPLRLTLADLVALPAAQQRVDHFCVEGWTAVATFWGVRVRELARLAGARPEARHVDFRSFDDDYHESWDAESALHPQTLVVYAKDGAYLNAAYGAPARVHAPIKLGYKNTKYLTHVTFRAERNGGYWTDRGYEWFGGT